MHVRKDFTIHAGSSFNDSLVINQSITDLEYRNKWTRFGQYEIADVVRYLGVHYHCIQEHTAAMLPDSTPLFWQPLVPQDLTGQVFLVSLRRTPDSSVFIPFTIVLTPLTGTVSYSLTAVQTAALSGRYVYAMEGNNAGNVTTYLHGFIDIVEEVVY